jgi:hypothetical protein
MLGERVRLADLLAAVSVATDLGMGQEPEKAMYACLVATALARRMGTPESDVSEVYYTALLRHLGCTATAHEEAYLGGDELVSRPAAERADFGNARESFALLLQMGRGTGVDRARYITRAPCGSGSRATGRSWGRSARSAPGWPSGWAWALGFGTACTRASSGGTARELPRAWPARTSASRPGSPRSVTRPSSSIGSVGRRRPWRWSAAGRVGGSTRGGRGLRPRRCGHPR